MYFGEQWTSSTIPVQMNGDYSPILLLSLALCAQTWYPQPVVSHGQVRSGVLHTQLDMNTHQLNALINALLQ